MYSYTSNNNYCVLFIFKFLYPQIMNPLQSITYLLYNLIITIHVTTSVFLYVLVCQRVFAGPQFNLREQRISQKVCCLLFPQVASYYLKLLTTFSIDLTSITYRQPLVILCLSRVRKALAK